MRVPIDFEAEGLLDGADDRDARLDLLRTLEQEGFTVEELREAAAHDRLALLPVERVLAGEGKLYTREELAEQTGLDSEFLDEAARALGVPVREPGERAITEEEMELSRSAKALIDAGLSAESFLELTAVMSRSMPNIAASLRSVFGEAFLHPGDTERDLGLRYAEALRNLGPLAAPTLEHMFNLRLREQMREAVISQAELQSGRLAGVAAGDRGLRGHRGVHAARGGHRAGGPGHGRARLRALRVRGRERTGTAREDDRRRRHARRPRAGAAWSTRFSDSWNARRTTARFCAAASRPARACRGPATGTGAP